MFLGLEEIKGGCLFALEVSQLNLMEFFNIGEKKTSYYKDRTGAPTIVASLLLFVLVVVSVCLGNCMPRFIV